MTQTAQNLALAGASAAVEKLESFLSPIVEGLGYEIVHLEVLSHRQKTICLYIDHFVMDHFVEGAETKEVEPIGIEDCAKVSRAVDEPLEMLSSGDAASGEAVDTTLKALLASGFELEVSSPGIDRPLRKEKDFKRFQGREIRISTFRPLSETELQNQEYFLRNPKQKNYLGELTDFQKGEILLKVSASMGSLKKELSAGNKPGAKKSANPLTNLSKNKSINKKLATKPEPKVDFVHIPLSLVSKANLEPQYDIVSDDDEISEKSSKEKS